MHKPTLRWCMAAAAVLAAATGVPTVARSDAAPIQIEESAYPTSQGEQPMTVYRPASDGHGARHPGLILVHGGAWVRGNRELLDSEARAAAHRGFVVFNIDYRLDAPRNPRQYHDVEAAIEFARSHAADYALDPERLGGLGTSAGAHLLMQAVTADKAPLAAMVGWSGPYDLTGRAGTSDAMLASVAALVFLGCLPATPSCAEQAAAASPALHTASSNPPMMLFNSSHELIPLTQMTSFADRLRADGVTVHTQIIPGRGHAVAYADTAIGPTLDFLSERLHS